MPAPATRPEQLREGEAFFLGAVERTHDLSAPCALPGWSRAHLVAHMARNADALCNLLSWARTGVATPMYASAEARTAGIEESARQAPAALRADMASASARLVAELDGMPAEAWDAIIRTARGREIPASDVPWMRIRESWVHAVDLDAGATFAEIPAAVVRDFLDEVAAGVTKRDDCPAMTVVVGDASWQIGPAAGERVTVAGSAADVLAWLIGRAPLDAAPEPPRWL